MIRIPRPCRSAHFRRLLAWTLLGALALGPLPSRAQDGPRAPKPAAPAKPAAGPPAVALDEPAPKTSVTPTPAEDQAPAPATPAPPAAKIASTAPARLIVALLDFESSTLDQGTLQTLSQELWTRLGQDKEDFKLLPRDPVRRWLIANDLHPFMPFGPEIPLSTVTRALRAQVLITGRINRINATYVVEVGVYSLKAGRDIFGDAKPRTTQNVEALLTLMSTLGGQIQDAIDQDGGIIPPEKVEVKKAVAHTKTIPSATKPLVAKVHRKAGRKAGAKGIVEHDPALAAPSAAPAAAPLAPSGTSKPPAAQASPAGPAAAPAEAKTGAHPVILKPLPAASPVAPARPAAKPSAPTPAAPQAGDQTESARAAFKAGQDKGTPAAKRLACYEEAARLAPGEFLYQKQLAVEYYTQHQYERAAGQCERALKVHPGDSMILTLKGTAHLQSRQLDKAAQAYEAALAANPANHWARRNLAVTRTKQNDPGAARAWREYIARAQDDPAQKELVAQARGQLAKLEAGGAGH